jgi:hypothetical protein
VTITSEMLQAAIRKAVEAGLLPRQACPSDMELIRFILQAALDTVSTEAETRPHIFAKNTRQNLPRLADIAESKRPVSGCTLQQ